MTKDPSGSERLGPPSVEPLSDVAWARVERGLWARLDGSNNYSGEALQGPPERPNRWVWIAVPLVAAAAAVMLVIALRSGNEPVEVADTGSDAGDVRVVSPGNAPTSASFNDAYIELEPASVVVMRHDQPITVLERGAAAFTVAPRGPRAPFVVIAGETKVRVIGTKFRVSRESDRVTVDVDHGTVEVQHQGSIVRVTEHEKWTSERPREVAGNEIEMDPIAKPKPEPKLDDRAKFDRLAALEKTNPNAAIAGYLELSQTSSKWAANALYAAGRLAVDRKDARAASLLNAYLKRFPSGPNADDARQLLGRLQ